VRLNYILISKTNLLNKTTLIFTLLLTAINLQAQIGGESTYQFMSLPNSARSSSLSNSSIGLWDNDLNLSIDNPSLLDSNSHQQLALNYADYIADINYGMVAYAHHVDNVGTFAVALNYMHYGTFNEADATGKKYGTFSASDYAFNILYSKSLYPNLQIGANLKILYSNYYQYSSAGIALDAGVTYHIDKKQMAWSFVIKNFGHQIKPYREGNFEPLPFDMQLGFSKKMSHAPFRVLVAIHHLHNWDMAFDSPIKEKSTILGEEEEDVEVSWWEEAGDEGIRHLNVGVELIPLKNVYIRAGYNFQRMKEMVIDDKFGMVGFSVGAGIRIYKFHISYARAVYHVAGGTNTFSITSNLSEFF